MITRLSIQHYRSIENLDLALGPVNVLVGRNGAGKSNIVDTVKFVRDALRYGLDQAITDRNGIASIRQWSPTRPYDISIAIEVERRVLDQREYGRFSFTLASSGQGYVIKREEGSWNGLVRTAESSKPVIAHSSYTRDAEGRVACVIMGETIKPLAADENELFLVSRSVAWLSGLKSLLTDFEKYAIFPNTLRQAQRQSTETYLTMHGDNLASVLKRMRNKKKSEAISEITTSMQMVIPDLESILIQSVGSFIVPQFRVRSPANNGKVHSFDVDQLSDGGLRILGLLVALYQDPIPATIALEEPELTVHPGALQLISDSIAEVSGTAQILVTTHSPEFLDRFAPADIIAVEYENEVTVARPLAKHQVEAVRGNLFSLGQLMSMEGLHG